MIYINHSDYCLHKRARRRQKVINIFFISCKHLTKRKKKSLLLLHFFGKVNLSVRKMGLSRQNCRKMFKRQIILSYRERDIYTHMYMGFPGGASDEEPACQCRRCKRCWFSPCIGNIPWRKAWQPTPVFLPGEPHGQRSLVSYSPWGFEESDSAEHIAHGMARNGDGSIWIISMDNCGCWPRMRLAASLWMWSRQGLVHQGTNCC